MSVTSTHGYLNKKQIEGLYGRSYRSLTRDITQAVRISDHTVLQYLKLVTEDGEVREGSDVTLEMIQELSNNGRRPMWLAEEGWVADWCAKSKRNRRHQHVAHSPPPPTSRHSIRNAKPSGSPELTPTIELLQERIQDLKQQNEMLLGQLQIKDEQIRSTTLLADQSQQLMRDLHVLLKNVQDGLLKEGSRPLLAPRSNESLSVKAVQKPTKVEAPISPRRKSKPTPMKSVTKKSKTSDAAATKNDGRLQRWLPAFFGQKPRAK